MTDTVHSPQSEERGTEDDVERLLRETVRSLLKEGEVGLVIGYEQGTLPLRTTPCFIRSPGEAERLVWNPCCENNLSTYLRNRGERVAVVAKGCDVRSIVGLIVERQVVRENIVIIGIPCQGIIDRHKVESRLGEAGADRGQSEGSPIEILEATFGDGDIILTGERANGSRFQERIRQQDVLHQACLTCEHRTPSLYDVLIGDAVPAVEINDPFAEVRALEAQSSDERWAYFSQEFSKCIRCYACREACPLCYCQECFIDQTQPRWFDKTDDPSDTLIFHIVRALHVAGRCVDCGACSRACPMGIDLRALTRKMIKDVREWYGYQAGIDLEAIPPLATFRPDDPQEFIK